MLFRAITNNGNDGATSSTAFSYGLRSSFRYLAMASAVFNMFSYLNVHARAHSRPACDFKSGLHNPILDSPVTDRLSVTAQFGQVRLRSACVPPLLPRKVRLLGTLQCTPIFDRVRPIAEFFKCLNDYAVTCLCVANCKPQAERLPGPAATCQQ